MPLNHHDWQAVEKLCAETVRYRAEQRTLPMWTNPTIDSISSENLITLLGHF